MKVLDYVNQPLIEQMWGEYLFTPHQKGSYL